MAVTKRPGHWILTAALDEVSFGAPTYVKYIAFETADATADGTFNVTDTDESTEVSLVPKYDFVLADLTPPAQFAFENFVHGVKIASLPTGGRVFVYHGRRP